MNKLHQFAARSQRVALFTLATCLAAIAPMIVSANSILFVHQPEPPEDLLK
ncbi:hypothetical protein C162_21998 [Paenibacillus sp. FSL R7-269]|uniref:cyclic lactone autoinducer peptide n=1 Tax=Paenibacillus sp. FSL R7-269 TaxID=1226755 RepID=UPI0003E1FCB6|nr:cyclic lactone autoinducer peptide [Paenibacillus sp. FSL R7-269]ETT45254.1 hypothetical protein C162_21998 [Paenibacillus sp. FSL R7-269]